MTDRRAAQNIVVSQRKYKSHSFVVLVIIVGAVATRCPFSLAAVAGSPAVQPEDVNDVLAHAGRLLIEGQPIAALDALSKVESVEQDNPWVLLLQGRSYKLLGEPYKAMERYDRALNAMAIEAAPDEQLVEQIRIERRQAERQVHSLVMRFGLARDTNVTFRGGGVSEFVSGERDYKFFSGLNWDFAPMVTQQEAVITGLRLAHSWHFEIDEYDDQGYGAYALYRRRLSDFWSFDVQYDYDFLLLGRDSFLSNHAISPRFTYHWPGLLREGSSPSVDLLQTRFDYTIAASDFLYSDRREFDRDAFVNSFGVEQSVRVRPIRNWNWTYDLFAGYTFTLNPTEGTEYDRNSNDFYLGLLAPLKNSLLPERPSTVRFSALWELDNYEDQSLYDSRRRERRDLITTLDLAYSQTLFDTLKNGELTVTLFLQWSDADSNIVDADGGTPFSYEKTVAGFQFEWRF